MSSIVPVLEWVLALALLLAVLALLDNRILRDEVNGLRLTVSTVRDELVFCQICGANLVAAPHKHPDWPRDPRAVYENRDEAVWGKAP